jgi:transposase
MYEKATHIQKAWKKEFGTDPPSRKTIAALNKKFDETGSVADLSRSGRPKSSRTEEKVALVQAALKKDPSRSIRSLSTELGVNKAAVHRIKQGETLYVWSPCLSSQMSYYY